METDTTKSEQGGITLTPEKATQLRQALGEIQKGVEGLQSLLTSEPGQEENAEKAGVLADCLRDVRKELEG